MIKLQNKKFIFVAGPSESGKSSGINYIVSAFQMVKHLKIRNIFRELYEKSSSSMDYDAWYAEELRRDFRNHWEKYLELAVFRSEDKDIIIMDTLYNPEVAMVLYDILANQLHLLYIDAPFNVRVKREYERLRKDSTFSDRKADLSITLEDVSKRTTAKDAKKLAEGIDNYPKLVIRSDNSVTIGGEGRSLVYVINNTVSEEDFHKLLNSFMNDTVLC
ncbi:MAG: hypothetical protein LBE20_02095 [Deltaproteobacteria bacterium]|jgi:cytidylate kinase|nr:hypothetical protein [Deltaproteobacteria bacterium]